MLVIHSPHIYQPSPLRPTPQSTRLLVSIVQSSEGVCSLTLTFFLPLLSHLLLHTPVLLCLLLVSIVLSREDALSLLTL